MKGGSHMLDSWVIYVCVCMGVWQMKGTRWVSAVLRRSSICAGTHWPALRYLSGIPSGCNLDLYDHAHADAVLTAWQERKSLRRVLCFIRPESQFFKCLNSHRFLAVSCSQLFSVLSSAHFDGNSSRLVWKGKVGKLCLYNFFSHWCFLNDFSRLFASFCTTALLDTVNLCSANCAICNANTTKSTGA